MQHFPPRDQYDVSSLTMCAYGGAALPAEVLSGFEEAFGCALLEGYGLSGTSPVALLDKRAGRLPGTIGTPVDGVEMKVVRDDASDLAQGEIGEIAIRGHHVMQDYWGRREATAEAIDAEGWFRTGDRGRMDEDGFFTIVDRRKEMIMRGGFNVHPREIEEVLYEHQAVRECAVLGIPDHHLGEEVGAAVVLKDSATATPKELREFVRTRVAAHTYPRRGWLSADLPKGPTNKILKREIQIPEVKA